MSKHTYFLLKVATSVFSSFMDTHVDSVRYTYYFLVNFSLQDLAALRASHHDEEPAFILQPGPTRTGMFGSRQALIFSGSKL